MNSIDAMQRLTKMERLNMVVDYAKSMGFSSAKAIFWRENQEEIGGESPFEQPDSNEVMPHGIGISLDDEVAAVWFVPHQNESADDRRLVFDTREQAQRAIDLGLDAAKGDGR